MLRLPSLVEYPGLSTPLLLCKGETNGAHLRNSAKRGETNTILYRLTPRAHRPRWLEKGRGLSVPASFSVLHERPEQRTMRSAFRRYGRRHVFCAECRADQTGGRYRAERDRDADSQAERAARRRRRATTAAQCPASSRPSRYLNAGGHRRPVVLSLAPAMALNDIALYSCSVKLNRLPFSTRSCTGGIVLGSTNEIRRRMIYRRDTCAPINPLLSVIVRKPSGWLHDEGMRK
jgi:hypothetical protein